MTVPGSGPRLSRRATLLLPIALGGCGLFDDWFGSSKKPLPGKREAISAVRRGLTVDEGAPKVTLPPPIRNAAWPQAGGNPAHLLGHLAGNERLTRTWSVDIGAGGGYRRKLMAQPIVANGLVFAMDSAAKVTAYDLGSGARRWRLDTKDDDVDSTNVGGGLAYESGTLYAVNGLADLVAIEADTGKEKWRTNFTEPARSAPTIAEGRLFLVTIQDKLLGLAADDGRLLWSHQAQNPATSVLGQPAPAYSSGLVVGGFGSGELSALRADTGTLVWSDSLGANRARASAADLSSIRGIPVVSKGQVFAIGLGGLAVGMDLPAGRRLWERQVAGEDNPWVAGSWMFIISTNQEVAAINTDDGRVAWVSALPRWENPEKQRGALTWYGPLLVGDRLIVAGTSAEALALSPYSGEILGRQELSAAASGVGPIVADGTVLIMTDDGRLTAWR